MTLTEPKQGPAFAGRGRWSIDPDRLEIRFSVEFLKITTVEGRFGRAEGAIVLDDGAPHWSRVDLFINAASIDTRNPIRDFHLRARDYLDVKRFPQITLECAHVVPLDDTTYRLTGDLTIRGITREVSLYVEQGWDIVKLGARRLRFSAGTRIDRKDFGVDPGVAGLGFLIGNEVTVRVSGEATEQPHSGTKPREVSA